MRNDQPFEAVSADVLHDPLRCGFGCLQFGVFFAPDVYSFRRGQNREACEVSFYADALDFLNSALEVPVAVGVA